MNISEIELPKLTSVVSNPSGLDSLSNYSGPDPAEFAHLLVVLTRSRDSDCLTESNFEVALEQLGGEENENVEIHRFGHWACGWWEALVVKEGTEQHRIAQEIDSALSDYPVLNDEHFSLKEMEHASDVWRDCYTHEDRMEHLKENEYQLATYFTKFGDLLNCARGNYCPDFNGYCEIIN
jgi:hypothetical protein